MKFKLCLIIPLLFICYSTFGQEKPSTTIRYPDNVNAPLTKKEKAMIKEVYQSRSKEVVLDDETFLKDIKHLLRNRIEIYEVTDQKGQKKCKLLSEVPLNNTYNKNIKRNETFEVTTFNPLKYKLDFFARGTYLYRIDNSDYFILITSQYRLNNSKN